jgi:hypothetical protein
MVEEVYDDDDEDFLHEHNHHMNPSDRDEVWSKVVAFVKNIPMPCRTPLARKKIGSIPDF